MVVSTHPSTRYPSCLSVSCQPPYYLLHLNHKGDQKTKRPPSHLATSIPESARRVSPRPIMRAHLTPYNIELLYSGYTCSDPNDPAILVMIVCRCGHPDPSVVAATLFSFLSHDLPSYLTVLYTLHFPSLPLPGLSTPPSTPRTVYLSYASIHQYHGGELEQLSPTTAADDSGQGSLKVRLNS